MSNLIKDIINFQKERNLHLQKYDYWNESLNIIEEVIEGNRFSTPKINRQLLGSYWEDFIQKLIEEDVVKYDAFKNKDHESIDYLNDIIVFAVGAILKQGYDPELTLAETIKEINSRKGKIVNGKFEKFTDEKSKSNWYKADYSKCRIKDER